MDVQPVCSRCGFQSNTAGPETDYEYDGWKLYDEATGTPVPPLCDECASHDECVNSKASERSLCSGAQ